MGQIGDQVAAKKSYEQAEAILEGLATEDTFGLQCEERLASVRARLKSL